MSTAPQFATPAVFKHVLEKRVEGFLANRRTTDSPLMYAKAIGLFAASALSYYFLVFRTDSIWAALAWGFVLAMALVGIGFNVQHDGNHGGFSRYKWVNRSAGFTLDLIGASSYFWADKHNHNHHVYTNIPHEDADINLGPLARLSEEHRWLWFHRFQHIYLWALYAFVHLRYLFTDLHRMSGLKKDGLTENYPRGWDLVAMIAGKVIFLTFAFAIPLTQHSFGRVAGIYVLVSMAMGIVFSTVFQLAHTVDNVEHPLRGATDHNEWVIHQIRTTANFAPRNWFLTFTLGGLNFQREHHLFPKISHVHYPAISKVVRAVCQEYKVDYCESPSVWEAIRSHYRFVKAMGAKP
ncbi:MAG: acyl-CoA desaturase [Acidobacteria bacterium]|nr:MAG: acyl-CoA desaturase [Acidobacteriota bacterium]